MNQGDILLRAIMDDPKDDLARLAYADFLDETSTGKEEFSHAASIRYGMRWPERIFECEHDGNVGLICRNGYALCYTCHEMNLLGVPRELLGNGGYIFKKGFIHKITCHVRDWRMYGCELMRKHPVEVLELTHCLPFYEKSLKNWCLRRVKHRDENFSFSLPDAVFDSLDDKEYGEFFNKNLWCTSTEENGKNAACDAYLRWAKWKAFHPDPLPVILPKDMR